MDDPFFFNFDASQFPKSLKKSSKPIQASLLEGKILENLKFLKSLLQTEAIRHSSLQQENQKHSQSKSVEKQIIDQLSALDEASLAKFEIPKKYHAICFDLLTQAWRKKIHENYSQIVSFSDLSFSKVSIKSFVIALSLNVELQALRLDHAHLTLEHSKILAVLIKVHPTLRVLHLNDHPLKDEGFIPLFEALSLNNQLVNLSINAIGLTDESGDRLMKLIKKGNLQFLSLVDNHLSESLKDQLLEQANAEEMRLDLD